MPRYASDVVAAALFRHHDTSKAPVKIHDVVAYNKLKRERIKIKANDETYQISIAQCNGNGGLMEVLLHVNAFLTGITQHEYSDIKTPKLLFSESLFDTAKTTWSKIASASTDDSYTFLDTIKEYVAAYATQSSNYRHEQRNYVLHSCHLTDFKKMSSMNFFTYLSTCNDMVDLLPGQLSYDDTTAEELVTPSQLTGEEVKRVCFFGMPETWKLQFRRAEKILDEMSLDEMLTFMRNREEENPNLDSRAWMDQAWRHEDYDYKTTTRSQVDNFETFRRGDGGYSKNYGGRGNFRNSGRGQRQATYGRGNNGYYNNNRALNGGNQGGNHRGNGGRGAYQGGGRSNGYSRHHTGSAGYVSGHQGHHGGRGGRGGSYFGRNGQNGGRFQNQQTSNYNNGHRSGQGQVQANMATHSGPSGKRGSQNHRGNRGAKKQRTGQATQVAFNSNEGVDDELEDTNNNKEDSPKEESEDDLFDDSDDEEDDEDEEEDDVDIHDDNAFSCFVTSADSDPDIGWDESQPDQVPSLAQEDLSTIEDEEAPLQDRKRAAVTDLQEEETSVVQVYEEATINDRHRYGKHATPNERRIIKDHESHTKLHSNNLIKKRMDMLHKQGSGALYDNLFKRNKSTTKKMLEEVVEIKTRSLPSTLFAQGPLSTFRATTKTLVLPTSEDAREFMDIMEKRSYMFSDINVVLNTSVIEELMEMFIEEAESAKATDSIEYGRYEELRHSKQSRALAQIRHDSINQGSQAYIPIVTRQAYEEAEKERQEHHQEENNMPWHNEWAFFHATFGNLNISGQRMETLGQLQKTSVDTAFQVYCRFWHTFGTIMNQDEALLLARNEDRTKKIGEKTINELYISNPPISEISLKEALAYTNPPTLGRFRQEEDNFRIPLNHEDNERPYHILEDNQKNNYGYNHCTTSNGYFYKVMIGHHARAIQQFEDDVRKFGPAIIKPQGTTESVRNAKISCNAYMTRHKIHETVWWSWEYFEENMGDLHIHPTRAKELKRLSVMNRALGYKVYCTLWDVFGTLHSHNEQDDGIYAQRLGPKYTTYVEVIKPTNWDDMPIREALERTAPNEETPSEDEEEEATCTSLYCFVCSNHGTISSSKNSHHSFSRYKQLSNTRLKKMKGRSIDETTTFIHEMMKGEIGNTERHFLQSRELDISSPAGNEEQCILSEVLVPSTILIVDRMQNQRVQKPLHALMDSGSDTTLIARKAIPKGIRLTKLEKNHNVKGVMGEGLVKTTVRLQNLMLPELHPTLRMTKPINCLVLDHIDHYDMIVGRNIMKAFGIDILNSSQELKCMDYLLPFRPRNQLEQSYNMHRYALNAFLNDDIVPKGIEAARYEAHDTDEIASAQLHLSPKQRQDLRNLLRKFPTLFDGQLRVYPHRKIHLELLPGSTPKYLPSFPVARSNLQAFKEELQRMVKINVLEPCGASEWASPTFIIPKKDGTVRWVSDFRELNKCIKRRIYPLPRIQDVLKKRKGYKYFTKLDLSMAYYTYELDEDSKDLCVINTPFGRFRYNRLPMGVKQSPDVAQEILENLMQDIEECDVYIDDIGCFGDSWDQHMHTLSQVLTRLRDNNFALNPRKAEWAQQETDWLGYWLTPVGLKPWKKKVDAILKQERPQTLKQLRSFIGAVTYYRDMFRHRSHVLAPLTELTKCTDKVLQWGAPQDKAFKQMKAIMAQEVLLRYPDHNLPFQVYSDASDYQLGAIIVQEGMPVAYYSRKLNAAQKNYTTMEKELLSIVETLREYRTMLFGCKELNIYTDHRNLTFHNLNSQRVIRWRLFIEEFHPNFHYIKGESNNIADAMSRLPRSEEDSDETQLLQAPKTKYNIWPAKIDLNKGENEDDKESRASEEQESETLHAYSIMKDDSSMVDCFVHHPMNFPRVTADKPFPLDLRHLAREQEQDKNLKNLLTSKPQNYHKLDYEENDLHQLICYVKKLGDPWKICIPDTMLTPMIQWYHRALVHPGETRMIQTMALNFYHQELRTRISTVVRSCKKCQANKVTKAYAELPARLAEVAPWQTIAIDLIGPWNVKTKARILTFFALTIIDTVTNFPEVIRVNNKTPKHVAEQFRIAWLCRYPRPINCVFDRGGEFRGVEFQEMLKRYGIKSRQITSKNPQANSIVERLHQTMGNSLRTLIQDPRPETEAEATALVDSMLQTAAYAARAAIHTTLQVTPGSLAFQRDMILNIPLIADFKLLQDKRQAIIDQQLIRANKRRISHDYQPNERVWVIAFNPNKMERRTEGPYTIEKIHTNGTVTINRTEYLSERINIRRIKPYTTAD